MCAFVYVCMFLCVSVRVRDLARKHGLTTTRYLHAPELHSTTKQQLQTTADSPCTHLVKALCASQCHHAPAGVAGRLLWGDFLIVLLTSHTDVYVYLYMCTCRRMTAHEALNDPWLAPGGATTTPIRYEVIRRLEVRGGTSHKHRTMTTINNNIRATVLDVCIMPAEDL